MGQDADLEEVMKGEYIETETGLKLDTDTYLSSSATRYQSWSQSSVSHPIWYGHEWVEIL